MAATSDHQLIRNDQWKPPRVQRPDLPFQHLIERRVGDPRHQIPRHLAAVDVGEVVATSPVVIPLAYSESTASSKPLSRRVCLGTTDGAKCRRGPAARRSRYHRCPCGPSSSSCRYSCYRSATRRIAVFIAEVFTHLDLQRGLQHPAGSTPTTAPPARSAPPPTSLPDQPAAPPARQATPARASAGRRHIRSSVVTFMRDIFFQPAAPEPRRARRASYTNFLDRPPTGAFHGSTANTRTRTVSSICAGSVLRTRTRVEFLTGDPLHGRHSRRPIRTPRETRSTWRTRPAITLLGETAGAAAASHDRRADPAEVDSPATQSDLNAAAAAPTPLEGQGIRGNAGVPGTPVRRSTPRICEGNLGEGCRRLPRRPLQCEGRDGRRRRESCTSGYKIPASTLFTTSTTTTTRLMRTRNRVKDTARSTNDGSMNDRKADADMRTSHYDGARWRLRC